MKTAIVTGGLRGLGEAMAIGLCAEGFNVVAVGHLEEDAAMLRGKLDGMDLPGRFLPLVADLRDPDACSDVVEKALTFSGRIEVLINNAALTFTYIWPDRYRRQDKAKPWEASDEIVQRVMDTNYVAADQMARRCVPIMVANGWGRLINVTTNLATMNDADASAYGASKAALEMSTECWAKSLEGSGVTANILNPGSGANTPGIAIELRELSRQGQIGRLVEPTDMVAPLLWLASADADHVNGFRFDANAWNAVLPPSEAARHSGLRAGFAMHPREPQNLLT